MIIEIDDNIFRGILKYSEKHKIQINKIIEESTIQNQIRHNIDMDGNIYTQKIKESTNIYELADLINELNFGINCETKKEYFGIIFDNMEIKNYKYIIGRYKGKYTIIFITENEEEMMEKITKNKSIKIERIEESQTYCWVTTYETKVLITQFEKNNDIIILI
jgi:hypothetical protein